jgi:hypothetical protein
LKNFNDDSEDYGIDDDLLLTRTEGTMKFNTGVLSTQRDNFSNGGEFEKKITDIKSKLNQIKNTINCEIELSSHVNKENQ